MTVHAPPPVFVVPDNAPFSHEQRAWLSGYLAALLSPGGRALGPSDGQLPAAPDTSPVLADSGDAPWHDPSLGLAERMRLAAARPLAPRMMAAMAQQDCGQCGYTCAAYANALFLKQEQRFNLCVPGGKETLRTLKTLADEIGNEQAAETPASAAAAHTANAVSAEPYTIAGYSREAPVEGVFLSRRRLNGPTSEKETWHIEIALPENGLDYAVGDSLGVLPVNSPALVDAVIARLGARPERIIAGRTFRDHLFYDFSLGSPPDALFQLLSYLSGGEQRRKARALAAGEDPDGDAAHLDVLGALHKFAAARPDAEAFLEVLDPLQPRLYSISSSPQADAGKVSLTVDAVRYSVNKRPRLGVASTFLAERLEPGAAIKVYVQKARHFALPQDPATPIIMIGPGTGIAPFRAFLRERQATRAPGRNWLFFGHRREETDFFYKDELTAMKQAGVLHRLTLAWSRQGPDKIYVQDRMREVGADLWRWLAEGAHVYVCGDARRMAKDVEQALVDVVAKQGMRSTDEAIAFVQALKRNGRYQADVY